MLICALYKIREMSKLILVAQDQFYNHSTLNQENEPKRKSRKIFHSKNCKPQPIQNSGDTTRKDNTRQRPRKPIKAATAD